MLESIHEDALIRHNPASTIVSDPSSTTPFLHLPLHSITHADLDFRKPFEVKISQDIDALDGWVIWFDVFFGPSRDIVIPENVEVSEWRTLPEDDGGVGVSFTTGPFGKETHWKQALLLIDHGGDGGVGGSGDKEQPQPLKKGQPIRGEISYRKPKMDSRELDIELSWTVEDQGMEDDGSSNTEEKRRTEKKERKQIWFMR